MTTRVRTTLAATAAHAALSTLFRTVRFDIEGDEHVRTYLGARPFVGVVWHGRMLAPTYLHRNEGFATLVSRSRDGEYITGLLRRWGYETVRGSSSRGAATATRELIRQLRAGRPVVLTPDGPRGPRERIKEGALYVASEAGVPIFGVTSAADRAWWIEGWDRILVPQPFSRVVIAYSAPFLVPADASPAVIAERMRDLEQLLSDLTRRADAAIADARA